MFKVFLLFFLRFISHSFLFFVFPSMKRVFLAFLVHKTVCNLPSKDFHMQTARRGGEGECTGGIPFDFVFVSWLMRYNFHAVKKAFSVCYYKKKNNNNNMRKNNYNLCALFYTSLPPPLSPVHSSVCRYLFSLHGGVRLDFCLLQFGCQKSTDRHLLFYSSCRCCSCCCCCCFCCAKRNYTLMNCLISCSQ